MGRELRASWYGLYHLVELASELIDLAGESIHSTRGPATSTAELAHIDMDVLWTEFRAVLADQFGAHIDCIDREAAFVADLGADSLDMVRILTAFEARYQIRIPQKDASRLVTVGDAFDFVLARTAA